MQELQLAMDISYRLLEMVEVFQPAEATGIQMKQSMQMETSVM